MSLTDKAIWVIERNLSRPLTLSELADACGVSRFHLARAFGAATGLSVMQYVRSRRLTEAARSLASDHVPDILDLVLDAGTMGHGGAAPFRVRRTAALDRSLRAVILRRPARHPVIGHRFLALPFPMTGAPQ